MCVELRKLRSNGAIRVSNEGQNTFCPSFDNNIKWHMCISSYLVGVLTEVPVMLALCWFANKTKGWFK